MKKSRILSIFLTLSLVTGLYFFFVTFVRSKQENAPLLTEVSAPRSFAVEIHAVGELEAMRSTSVTSAIRGDLGKIIQLVADGVSVKADELLIKMDPTPFEELIEDLKRQIQEQQSKVATLSRIVVWEKNQVDHEIKGSEIEIEAAQLEINKMIYGDGPIEEARLKSAVQKSFAKYNELKNFADDLADLQARDFLNPIELKQAENKLAEEEEAYLSAKMQYESYIHHTQPMQIKKAEIALKRCKNKHEEILKSAAFRIAKAQSHHHQSLQELDDLQHQLKNAEHQMTLTEIKAPNPGMVVLKEEFRNGLRRKPRLGDIVMRNQSILDLPDLAAMIVKTKVREIDLFKIKIGTPATIEVDAYPELQLKGNILSIGVLAVSDAAKTGEEKYFDVVVKLDGSDPRLRPGMTARLVFHANRVDNKWSIPIQSVFEFNKHFYCFVVSEKGCKAVPIEVGYNNEQWVEVKKGVEENLSVLLSMPSWANVENAHEINGEN